MSLLKKRTQASEIFENNYHPLYDKHGNPIKKRRRQSFKHFNWKPLVIILSCIAVFAGIIYIPQMFVTESNKGELIMRPDPEGYKNVIKYLEMKGGDDFDHDGLNNHNELRTGTDPFFPDSDGDGVFDGSDKSPLQADDGLYRSVLARGQNRKTPYEMNGVILWAADKDAWINGAVIETQKGYHFTNFKGWVKFPNDKFAFKLENGKHTNLKHKADTNTWYIAGDCEVTFSDEMPTTTNRITFFGRSFYLRNFVGDALSWLLPDKGWITGENMWLDDTFVDTSQNTYADFKQYNVLPIPGDRMSKYSSSLESLAEVYRSIDKNEHVFASLVSEEHGECIVEVYGYTASGDLIVADPALKSAGGILKISAHCARVIDNDGTLTEYGWFEFAGCGYDSEEDAIIAFLKPTFETDENLG